MLAPRKWSALALAFGLVVSLGACSDDDDDPVSAASSQPASSPAPDGSGVEIDMIDFGFEVSGGALPVGGTLELLNSGDEFHMLALAPFQPGKTEADLAAVLDNAGGEGPDGASPAPGAQGSQAPEDSESQVAPDGPNPIEAALGEVVDFEDQIGLPGAIMGPDQRAGIATPGLEAGEYALLCFLNVEGQETPHFVAGMYGSLSVVDAAGADGPEADAVYTLAAGEAIEGPATLPAGPTTLELKGTDISDLEPILVKPDQGVTFSAMDSAFDSFEEEGLPVGAADEVPGEVIFAGFDFGENDEAYLTVDLEPGTYVLVASDNDVEDAPSDPVEQITITVS